MKLTCIISTEITRLFAQLHLIPHRTISDYRTIGRYRTVAAAGGGARLLSVNITSFFYICFTR